MPAPLPIMDNLKIADAIASGMSQKDLAEQMGMDRANMCRKVKKLRPLIESMALDYFERNVKKATEINTTCLDTAQQTYSEASNMPFWCRSKHLADNSAMLQQAHKISDRILQSVGIAPSLAPSVVVQQFVQVNQQVTVDPQLAAMFSPKALAQLEQPVDEPLDCDWRELGESDE